MLSKPAPKLIRMWFYNPFYDKNTSCPIKKRITNLSAFFVSQTSLSWWLFFTYLFIYFSLAHTIRTLLQQQHFFSRRICSFCVEKNEFCNIRSFFLLIVCCVCCDLFLLLFLLLLQLYSLHFTWHAQRAQRATAYSVHLCSVHWSHFWLETYETLR